MKKHLLLITMVCLASLLTLAPVAFAADSPVGKWIGKADTPSGMIDIQLEIRQESGQIAGSVILFQTTVPLTAIKYEDPQLFFQLAFSGDTFKLAGTLKEGKLSGAWEQIGGDQKGTWNAERQGGPAVATPAPAGIDGSWNSLAVTPNGDMRTTLDLKSEGSKLRGTISSDQGSLEIQNASFKDNRLQFDLELGGNMYRIEATLKEDKFIGKWSPAGGTEGGAWSADRKAGAAATGAVQVVAASLDGDWNSVAETPDGPQRAKMTFKQSGDAISGSLATPEGSIPLNKAAFVNNKLSFEVTIGGNVYRVEATLANGKISGQWKEVVGGDSGAFSAERKTP